VPYVRGRERSRAAHDVLEEARPLLDDGVQEITLLGQNVNSYQGGGGAFAELLYRLDRMGVPRIRFMTSHPKDLSDELIEAYRTLPHLCKQLHLPVQAGSDRILGLMNRGYSREKYLRLVTRLREARPDIGLTTDLIVGFPGETEDEFEETLSPVEAVRFDAAFTFIYSPRPGTRAALMADHTPMEEKTRRIERLIALQNSITASVLALQVGTAQTVLVEGASTRNPGWISGKTDRGHMINFPGNTDQTGRMVEVEIIIGRPQHAARKRKRVNGGRHESGFFEDAELGDAIMQSDEYRAMKEAEDRAMANPMPRTRWGSTWRRARRSRRCWKTRIPTRKAEKTVHGDGRMPAAAVAD
jgi:tRNA-2-methylthio-N6-dimethylallyladenosine synthase